MQFIEFVNSKKTMVLELDDGVEYLFDKKSMQAIKKGEGMVPVVKRLDKTKCLVSLDRVEKALVYPEGIDYIES